MPWKTHTHGTINPVSGSISMLTKLIYMFLLVVLTTVGIAYENFTLGLAAKSADGPFYCNTLMSGGSDDTVMIFVLSLFSIPLAARIIRLYREISIAKVAVFYIVMALSVAELFIASLDCAEILYTAFGIPDFHLAIALIALPASALMLWKIRSGK